MAVRKPLTGFTTPLGTGAGVAKENRPPRIKDADTRLSRPFKVPFAQSAPRPDRKARQGKRYTEDGSLEPDEPRKRRGVLLPRAQQDNSLLLKRHFHVPFAPGKAPETERDPPPPLGTRRKAVLPARPLHDPTSEYAIVLYDPTVDVFPGETEETVEPEPVADKSGWHASRLALDETKNNETKSNETKNSGAKVTAQENTKSEKASSDPGESDYESDSDSTELSHDGTLSPDASSTSTSTSTSSSTSTSTVVKRRRFRHRLLADILGIRAAAPSTRVPVVIDPKLARVLRPHQVAGVRFLYRCTSGLVDARAKGCIMADEMGLGKTLQCLALMWTLLRQGPLGRRTIDKCIIVCPSSLVRNWANEMDKWLGPGALTPLAVDGKSTKSADLGQALQQWCTASGRNIVRPVLIISYETLRRNADKLAGTEVGLMLADEGHRLKNGDLLTFTALNSLRCERRVILSGTPIQNDLSEYFSLLTFANPGYLGTRNEFRRNYENTILRGRDADATDDEVKKGEQKLAELSQAVSKFIIRRTNDILSKYLPVKYEYVVFVGLSPFQRALYEHFISSDDSSKLIASQPLKAIDMLKKLCTHPDLLSLPDDIQGSRKLIPEDYQSLEAGGRGREIQTWFSAKFSILERFLHQIRTQTNDKIVVISNYTRTLDLIEKMCRYKRYGSLRLDGTMTINKRQKIVDRFNDPEGNEFIFLLSSKAGGCGINLIGANRLVLMDPDWNPAADQQALARVWRDGQKKDCFIYRFMCTGTIEEKIFQRQSMKLSLSSCVVDAKEDVERIFSGDALRLLFQYRLDTTCDTHDTYNCKRCSKEKGQIVKSPAMLYGDATTWNHLNHAALKSNQDSLLQTEADFDDISFAFQYISH